MDELTAKSKPGKSPGDYLTRSHIQPQDTPLLCWRTEKCFSNSLFLIVARQQIAPAWPMGFCATLPEVLLVKMLPTTGAIDHQARTVTFGPAAPRATGPCRSRPAFRCL